MSETSITLLIVISIPFLTVVICWIALMVTMHKTTGELKHWLTPDNLVKGIAIIFVITATLALGVLQILEGDVIATILGGIIGYTLGTSFPSLKN
ncbi:MAG: hypothetical protein RLZZ480_253 [Candidatus Parcubacteria bacterium]|jgi:hypothetical protein